MKITERLKVMLKSILSIQMGEVKTDKAVLIWDGEGELEAGMEVFVEGEDGEYAPAADGEYITEDNKTIVIVEGKVAEIRDPEAEVAPEEPANEEPIAEVKAEIEEPAAEPVEEEEKPAEESTEEDRLAILEGKVAEIIDGLNAIVNSIAALEGRIAEVEGKLAQVEAPAAEPIQEEPKIEERSRLSYLRKD